MDYINSLNLFIYEFYEILRSGILKSEGNYELCTIIRTNFLDDTIWQSYHLRSLSLQANLAWPFLEHTTSAKSYLGMDFFVVLFDDVQQMYRMLQNWTFGWGKPIFGKITHFIFLERTDQSLLCWFQASVCMNTNPVQTHRWWLWKQMKIFSFFFLFLDLF